MSWDGTDWGAAFTAVSAVFAGLSAGIAGWAIISQNRLQASQKILEQAELSLQWAWEALTDSGQHTDPPRADRLNWLTTARHLERYKALKIRITEEAHQITAEEREEYWRHRFYLCLDNKRLLQSGYYSQSMTEQSPIEPTSAVVVHAFAKWVEGKEDPLERVDVPALIASTKLLDGRPGLRMHLKLDSH